MWICSGSVKGIGERIKSTCVFAFVYAIFFVHFFGYVFVCAVVFSPFVTECSGESMLQWKNKKNNENVTGVFGSLNFRCIRNSRAAQFVCVGVLFLFYFIFVHFQEWIIFGGSCSGSADIDVCLVSACLFLFAPPIKCNVCMSVFFPGFIFGVYRLSCRPSSIAPNKWFRLQVKCI